MYLFRYRILIVDKISLSKLVLKSSVMDAPFSKLTM